MRVLELGREYSRPTSSEAVEEGLPVVVVEEGLPTSYKTIPCGDINNDADNGSMEASFAAIC
jgi:hypothetical protein